VTGDAWFVELGVVGGSGCAASGHPVRRRRSSDMGGVARLAPLPERRPRTQYPDERSGGGHKERERR